MPPSAAWQAPPTDYRRRAAGRADGGSSSCAPLSRFSQAFHTHCDLDLIGDDLLQRRILPLARRYEARLRRLKRATDVAAAEATHNAALDRVADVTAAMLRVTARSLSGFAIKARSVKQWGKPDWWDGDGTDTYERLAAQAIDTVIAVDAAS